MLNVLWVHGWGASPEVWRDVEHELPQYRHVWFSYAGCRTVAEARARLLEALVQERGCSSYGEQAVPAPPWAVVGWSLGGMLAVDALQQAWGQGERLTGKQLHTIASVPPVDRLILVGSTLRFTDHDRSRGWPPRVLSRMRGQLAASPQSTLEQFARSMFTPAELKQPAVSALLQQWRSDMGPELLMDGLGYLEEADLTPVWPLSARIQVRWIHGGNDSVCPPGAVPAEAAADCLFLPEAGHAPFLTSPERFYAGIRGFLNEDG